MATQALSTATPGSLAALGTAAKAFVLAHPVGMSLVGGALLGAGAYWGIEKLLRKKEQAPAAEPAAA
jgi:pantothenate kinase